MINDFETRSRSIPWIVETGVENKKDEAGGWLISARLASPVVGITPITATINPRSFTRTSTTLVFFALPIFILRVYEEFFRLG